MKLLSILPRRSELSVPYEGRHRAITEPDAYLLEPNEDPRFLSPGAFGTFFAQRMAVLESVEIAVGKPTIHTTNERLALHTLCGVNQNNNE